MRELRVVTPANVRRSEPATPMRYGPMHSDMVKYLAHKHRIEVQSMSAIVADLFRYIRAEVLVWGANFSVPNFGTFHRLNTAMNRNPVLFGEPVVKSYLRFRQPHAGADAPVRDDDAELVEPTDEERERFILD